jgi:FkbM family methyltransferase
MSYFSVLLKIFFKNDIHGKKLNLAEIQELQYLMPILRAFPKEWKTAMDIGANVGIVTLALVDFGFKVYSLEPHPETNQKLIKTLDKLIKTGKVEVIELAVSDQDGIAEMFVGSADTVNSIEKAWTTIAFPEYFNNKHVIDVPTRKLSTLFRELRINNIGFLKIDVEGHEVNVLKGLFDDLNEHECPPIIMFEANQRFPEKAEECLSILNARQYKQFDIFIKEGHVLLGTSRFSGQFLPKEWYHYTQRYFYANIIAYHSSFLMNALLPLLKDIL